MTHCPKAHAQYEKACCAELYLDYAHTSARLVTGFIRRAAQ
jgi:hypothetical protein